MRVRRAFTLVEVLVAMAVTIGLLWAAWAVFSTSTRQGHRIEGKLEASMALRNAADRITRELREALRLFYPSRYGHTADGVGFVDVKGHAVVVHSDEKGTEEGLCSKFRLVRSDMSTGKTELLMTNVNYFRVTLHPVPPGEGSLLRHPESLRPRTGDRGGSPHGAQRGDANLHPQPRTPLSPGLMGGLVMQVGTSVAGRRAMALWAVLILLVLAMLSVTGLVFFSRSGMKQSDRVVSYAEHLYRAEAVFARCLHRLRAASWERRFYASGNPQAFASTHETGIYGGAEYHLFCQDVRGKTGKVLPGFVDVIVKIVHDGTSRDYVSRGAASPQGRGPAGRRDDPFRAGQRRSAKRGRSRSGRGPSRRRGGGAGGQPGADRCPGALLPARRPSGQHPLGGARPPSSRARGRGPSTPRPPG